jgi:peptidoglycan/LPS O-acetylase OafA/YrhL
MMREISTRAQLNDAFGALVGLRGLAAAMVVLFHFEQENKFSYLSNANLWGCSLRQLIAHGYLWVDLFFALSGYILCKRYNHICMAAHHGRE